MPGKESTIHLSDLIERVYDYHEKNEGPFDQHTIDQLAIKLAHNDPNLDSDQKQLLKQISPKKMQIRDLRTHDETLYNRLLGEYWAKAEDKLHGKRAAKLKAKLKKRWGRAWKAKWTDSLWDYVVEWIRQPWEFPSASEFANYFELYCKVLFRYAQASADERKYVNHIANEVIRLDREGYANELLADIWNKYPEEAREMELPKPVGGEKLRHSPDFRSVHWYGNDYTFTVTQARVIQELFNAYKNGTPDVGAEYLLEKANSEQKRLIDLFKGSPAWGKLIVNGATKGTKRLADPQKN